MSLVSMQGRNIVGEIPTPKIPSDDELRSRFGLDAYSRLVQEGRKGHSVCTLYGTDADVMERRK